MHVIQRTETQGVYPSFFARGVVALVVYVKRGRIYQSGERTDGSLTKPVLIPDWIGTNATPEERA